MVVMRKPNPIAVTLTPAVATVTTTNSPAVDISAGLAGK
jgi:hypothetical protein